MTVTTEDLGPCRCTGCENHATAKLPGKRIAGKGDVKPMPVCDRHFRIGMAGTLAEAGVIARSE